MPRARVLSFLSAWGGPTPDKSLTLDEKHAHSTSTSPAPPPLSTADVRYTDSPVSAVSRSPSTPPPHSAPGHTASPTDSPAVYSPPPERRHSRRGSMIIAQPAVMEIAKDTPPELQPVFTHLNNHSNKLYQEGYFLKLHDLDSRGRPSNDRVWVECFAQLVGTVLSLWDAAQLDAAGDDGEVMPTFINMTDASLKMIESLPMNGADTQSLQNVLSISTAANNRYLLHFNSLHSLTQWTAGFRLAMYEHSSLQEAYTGSIIAGKGKHLNSIRQIMERSRFPTEDWARVRFGAGTPWRRCWCVIQPPDEKDVVKAQKAAKKRSAYEKASAVKGCIKFFDTRKITKKTKPIATVKDAYSAYAIYPQSKSLIDQSTLVKVDGVITVHSADRDVSTEGFVFVMPEVHAALSGFEMLMRWLLPAFDTFGLYGRPSRLVPDVMDVRSLMFAMPRGMRYGYLDLIDVAGLIHTEGSSDWSEREWRKQLKNLTSRRMSAPSAPNRAISSDQSSRPGARLSIGGASMSRSSADLPNGANRSVPPSRQGSPPRGIMFAGSARNASDTALNKQTRHHQRSGSDMYKPSQSSRLSFDQGGPADTSSEPPTPPMHDQAPTPPLHHTAYREQYSSSPTDFHDASPIPLSPTMQESQLPGAPVSLNKPEPLQPVSAPPSMAHRSNASPARRPAQPDFRRTNTAMDAATLAQLKDANPGGAQQQQANGANGPQGLGVAMSQLNFGQLQLQQPLPRSRGPSPNGQALNSAQPQNPYPGYPQQAPPILRRPPPSNQHSPQGSDRRLPTIPGTPSHERPAFDLDGAGGSDQNYQGQNHQNQGSPPRMRPGPGPAPHGQQGPPPGPYNMAYSGGPPPGPMSYPGGPGGPPPAGLSPGYGPGPGPGPGPGGANPYGSSGPYGSGGPNSLAPPYNSGPGAPRSQSRGRDGPGGPGPGPGHSPGHSPGRSPGPPGHGPTGSISRKPVGGR